MSRSMIRRHDVDAYGRYQDDDDPRDFDQLPQCEECDAVLRSRDEQTAGVCRTCETDADA